MTVSGTTCPLAGWMPRFVTRAVFALLTGRSVSARVTGQDRLHVNACGVLDVLLADSGSNNSMMMVQHYQVSRRWPGAWLATGGV